MPLRFFMQSFSRCTDVSESLSTASLIISFLYNAALMPMLRVMLACASVVMPKLRERQRGTRHMWQTLQKLPRKDNHTVRLWFHAASLGEFEQLKPIIERIRAPEQNKSFHNLSIQIIVSFFSPSGYRYQAHYALADAVVYLPVDTHSNAWRFVRLLDADAGVIARYDIWRNILRQCTLQVPRVPMFLVCATLNQRSLALRWKPLREWLCESYNTFHTIYTAGSTETAKFAKLGVAACTETASDTRFDRIAAFVNAVRSSRRRSVSMATSDVAMPSSAIPGAPGAFFPQHWFADDTFVVVVGSSWKQDEDIVLPAFVRLYKEYDAVCPVRIIVAPHEPSQENVRRIAQALQAAHAKLDGLGEDVAVLLSAAERGSVGKAQWGKSLVVDSVGKLLYLYSYASVAFIGGGYGAGVHSVTEPAGYGVPLASGYRVERARDALALQQQGVLTVVRTSEDCYQWLRAMFLNPDERARQGAIASAYIHSNTGWSQRIADDVLYHALERRSKYRSQG